MRSPLFIMVTRETKLDWYAVQGEPYLDMPGWVVLTRVDGCTITRDGAAVDTSAVVVVRPGESVTLAPSDPQVAGMVRGYTEPHDNVTLADLTLYRDRITHAFRPSEYDIGYCGVLGYNATQAVVTFTSTADEFYSGRHPGEPGILFWALTPMSGYELTLKVNSGTTRSYTIAEQWLEFIPGSGLYYRTLWVPATRFHIRKADTVTMTLSATGTVNGYPLVGSPDPAYDGGVSGAISLGLSNLAMQVATSGGALQPVEYGLCFELGVIGPRVLSSTGPTTSRRSDWPANLPRFNTTLADWELRNPTTGAWRALTVPQTPLILSTIPGALTNVARTPAPPATAVSSPGDDYYDSALKLTPTANTRLAALTDTFPHGPGNVKAMVYNATTQTLVAETAALTPAQRPSTGYTLEFNPPVELTANQAYVIGLRSTQQSIQYGEYSTMSHTGFTQSGGMFTTVTGSGWTNYSYPLRNLTWSLVTQGPDTPKTATGPLDSMDFPSAASDAKIPVGGVARVGNLIRYRPSTNTWVTLGSEPGATNFLGLTDTPANYTAAGLSLVQVKADQSGLEFITRATLREALITNPVIINGLAYALPDPSPTDQPAANAWALASVGRSTDTSFRIYNEAYTAEPLTVLAGEQNPGSPSAYLYRFGSTHAPQAASDPNLPSLNGRIGVQTFQLPGTVKIDGLALYFAATFVGSAAATEYKIRLKDSGGTLLREWTGVRPVDNPGSNLQVGGIAGPNYSGLSNFRLARLQLAAPVTLSGSITLEIEAVSIAAAVLNNGMYEDRNLYPVIKQYTGDAATSPISRAGFTDQTNLSTSGSTLVTPTIAAVPLTLALENLSVIPITASGSDRVLGRGQGVVFADLPTVQGVANANRKLIAVLSLTAPSADRLPLAEALQIGAVRANRERMNSPINPELFATIKRAAGSSNFTAETTTLPTLIRIEATVSGVSSSWNYTLKVFNHNTGVELYSKVSSGHVASGFPNPQVADTFRFTLASPPQIADSLGGAPHLLAAPLLPVTLQRWTEWTE